MKRTLLLLAAAVAPVLLVLSWGARPALACTGPGAVQAMLETPVILEGRVVAVTPLPQDNVRPGHAPYALAIEVAKGHRGAKAGDRIDALAYLPDPEVPQACATFEFQGELAGQYLVIGLQASRTVGGRMLADRAAASFVGPAPAGEEYERGRALAEMMADSNPPPLLTLVPPSPACGEAFRATGVRFKPGEYVVRAAFEGRILALAAVGSAGTFDVGARLVTSWCSGEQFNGKVVGLHARAVDPSSPGPTGLGALAEIAPVLLSGARKVEPGSPVLRVSPQTVRCGDEVGVTGAGFLPAERLNIGFGVAKSTVEAVADASGSLAIRFRLPAGECAANSARTGIGYNQLWAAQAEFGLTGPYFSLAVGEVYLEALDSPDPTRTGASPGPPAAGNGTTAGGDSVSAFAILLLVTIGGLSSVGVATRSLHRRLRLRR